MNCVIAKVKGRSRTGRRQRQNKAFRRNERGGTAESRKQAFKGADRRKGNGEFVAKKIERVGRVGFLTGVRQEKLYMAIKYIHESKGYPIERLCKTARLNRSSYCKWLKRKPSNSEVENTQISEWIKELYEEQNGILGYRQMTITLNRVHKTKYNIKHGGCRYGALHPLSRQDSGG